MSIPIISDPMSQASSMMLCDALIKNLITALQTKPVLSPHVASRNLVQLCLHHVSQKYN